MSEQRFNTISLFLNLILLVQIFSHCCFKAEATETNVSESFDKTKVGNKTGLNDHISDKDAGLIVIERPKRPARLLPLKMIL